MKVDHLIEWPPSTVSLMVDIGRFFTARNGIVFRAGRPAECENGKACCDNRLDQAVANCSCVGDVEA